MLKLCISGLVHINVVKKPHLLYSVYGQKLLLVYQFGVSVFKMHFLHTQKEVFKGMMVVRVFFFIKILVGFVHLVTRAKIVVSKRHFAFWLCYQKRQRLEYFGVSICKMSFSPSTARLFQESGGGAAILFMKI